MYFLRVKLTLSGSDYDADRTGGIYASLLPEQFPLIYASCRVSSPLDFELGVTEDPPVNSSYQFRALLGFHIMEKLDYPVDGYGGNIYYNNF